MVEKVGGCGGEDGSREGDGGGLWWRRLVVVVVKMVAVKVMEEGCGGEGW